MLYEYQVTREAEHPKRFLRGFRGYMHLDGYQGYEGLEAVTLDRCWAHARRKVTHALKVLPKGGEDEPG